MFRLFLMLILSSNALAQQLLYSSSSVPNRDQPWEVKIDKNKSFKNTKPSILKVKVFPHDLKNDHVHGVRDIKTQVALIGQIQLDNKAYSKLSLSYTKKGIRVRTNTNEEFYKKNLQVSSSTGIQVLRKNNEAKSHSYQGKLTVVVHDQGLMVINHVDIESYLRGVVPKESVSSWPLEALKAQTLAARSYAYYHMLSSKRTRWDVDDTPRFQVYAGVSAATAKTDLAIKETLGEVLTHQGKVITAFFHAYSGGRTDSAKNIFGKAVPYCLGGEEIFNREELKLELPTRSHWVVEWTTDSYRKQDLMTIFKQSRHTQNLFTHFSSETDYWLEENDFNVAFNSVKTIGFKQNDLDVTMDFKLVRKAIGWSTFPAYHYRVLQSEQDGVKFKGHGWGHHVGMSQWGAMMMAKNYGKTYREILHHYYSDVKIEKLADF